MTLPLGSHPTVRLTEIQRPELGDLAAIPRSGCQRSDAHDVATWQPSHGRSVENPTPTTRPLGSHPTVRLPKIRRPGLCHLAAIPRSGCRRSDVDDLATWQPSHGQTAGDPTPTSSPLGSDLKVSCPEIRRPPLPHLASIQRSGDQRSDAEYVATWQTSHDQADRDPTPRT
jgi:hypothetical protein